MGAGVLPLLHVPASASPSLEDFGVCLIRYPDGTLAPLWDFGEAGEERLAEISARLWILLGRSPISSEDIIEKIPYSVDPLHPWVAPAVAP